MLVTFPGFTFAYCPVNTLMPGPLLPQGGPTLGEAVVFRGVAPACGLPPACHLTPNKHVALALASMSPVGEGGLCVAMQLRGHCSVYMAGTSSSAQVVSND